MKSFIPFAACLVLAVLNADCSNRSSTSVPQSMDLTTAELTWGPKSIKGLETSLPGALGEIFKNADMYKDGRFTCKDGSTRKTRECTVKATGSNDNIKCTYGASTQPQTLMVYCKITASSWPQLAPEIANVIAPEFISLGFAQGSSFTSKSREGAMSCQETGGAWQCSFSDFLSLDKSINIPKKQNVTVPEGLKDEFGSSIPTRSKDSMLNLPSGSIQISTYRASDEVLAEFMTAIADKSLTIDEEGDAPNCKEAEKLALTYYTSEGHKVINSSLRNLAQGEKPDRKAEVSILAAISGMNCAPQGKERFVIRGVTLSPEKLAKYQKDAIIVEHSFTSTSIDEEVVVDFRGNTEFRIIEARGTNLSDFGVWSENGEKELLIAPGTIFKVLDRRVEGKTTIVEMQQLP